MYAGGQGCGCASYHFPTMLSIGTFGAVIAVAVKIHSVVTDTTNSKLIFKELGRRIQLLVQTLDNIYSHRTIPVDTQECLSTLHVLLLEIECYITAQTAKNKLQQFINHQSVLIRIQSYDQSLAGLCQVSSV